MTQCAYITQKKVKCCGRSKSKEIAWCRKHNAPLSRRLCMKCQKSGWLEKAGNIVEGYAEIALDTIAPVIPKRKSREFVKKRLSACHACQQHTYLTIQQFNQWIRENGGYARFVLEMDQLAQWPNLPDNKDPTHGKLFCRRCKCLLEAKANVKKEQCPIGNPDWQIDEHTKG